MPDSPPFTQGEWFTEGTLVYSFGPEIANKYDNSRYRFAARFLHGGNYRVGREELEANTHLASAAPKMYAALQRCRAKLMRAGGCESEIAEMDAAIAKAEGR